MTVRTDLVVFSIETESMLPDAADVRVARTDLVGFRVASEPAL